MKQIDLRELRPGTAGFCFQQLHRPPTIPGTLSASTVTVTIGANSPLTNTGSAALVQYSGGSLLVARTGANAFTALSSTCTHQGCLVTGFSNGEYVCPCHGSHYNTSGQVTQGPAPSPLPSFPTAFSNGQLTITVQERTAQGEDGRPYSPDHVGGRFAANAARASRRSAVVMSGR